MNIDWYLSHVFNADDGSLQIVAKKKLRSDMRERLQKAQKAVDGYFASLNVIEAALENRNELPFNIGDLPNVYRGSSANPEIAMRHYFSGISRYLANTCSLFRSLIDHFNRNYILNYGRASVEYKRWKNLIDSQRASSVEYCLMYGIRNYIQHYDMPPLDLSIKESADSEKFEYSLDLNIASLREDKRFDNELKAFHGVLLDKISLIALLDGWNACMIKVVNQIRFDMRRRVIRYASLIARIRTRLALDNSGRLAIIPIPRVKARPEKLTLSMSWLPESRAMEIIAAR